MCCLWYRLGLLAGVPIVVDNKRIETKLASLLVDGPTSSRKGSTAYKQKERDLRKFKRRYPSLYQTRVFKVFQAIADLDREVTIKLQQDIKDFDNSFKRRRF